MRLTLVALKAIQIPMELPTHQQKIKNLYKRMVRNLESNIHELPKQRYEAVVLRSRFDEHKKETDLVRIRELVLAAEKELYDTESPAPIKFPTSPGGVAYEREAEIPDWVLDYWHPLERAAYPEYFKRREQRKKEFVVWWEKQYGKPNPSDSHH